MTNTNIYHCARRKADHEGVRSTYTTDHRCSTPDEDPYEVLKAYAESLSDVKPGDILIGFRMRDRATFVAVVGSLATRVVFA